MVYSRRDFFKLAGVAGISVAAAGMSACSSSSNSSSSSSSSSSDGALETSTVRWNYGTSGNVLVVIAEEKGYFKDEGLTIEKVEATAVLDAMGLLSSGKADVASNAGTSNPLQQISNGVDLTIFGGHMLTGCMPVIAKHGAEWKGIESFVGQKVAVNPSYFAFTGALMEKGYDKPLEVTQWEIYKDYNDAMAAVVRGDVAYALLGTGQVQSAKKMAESGEIDIVCYQSDIMADYSCCRMVAQTSWVKNNPNTVKAVCRALIRAQQWYEANKQESVKLLATAINAQEDYVSAFMLDEHYRVNVDPLKNGVEKAWDILGKTNYLKENNGINIDDHINTELYKKALEDCKSKYGSQDSAFYDKMETFYKEHNA
jgi:NitT/TauT family transport system substrate-binding protein